MTGERQIGGHWYYFDGNGVMQTGFVNLGSKTVYYNSDGQMLYGEQKINNAWYYFDKLRVQELLGSTIYRVRRSIMDQMGKCAMENRR